VPSLRLPQPGRAAAEQFVSDHLAHLVCDDVRGSTTFAGGQSAADAALASYDVAGYADRRNEVWPAERRGASRLSPYIRHGLLSLPEVWKHVAGGPSRDVTKFRDELLWQEFSRHWYARLGHQTRRGIRNTLPDANGGEVSQGWPRDMACLDSTLSELEADGWLVNQTRMWLAGHWSSRSHLHWQDGEDHFFRHLLDGSRAANRLGWQWVTGAGSSKPYGLSRQQVERRAPGRCAGCALRNQCPIENWPDDPTLRSTGPNPLVKSDLDPETTAGPTSVVTHGEPDVVWLTAESLGTHDPALAARPVLPAIFVFDEALLTTLKLSSKRLIFLTEALAELAEEREMEVLLGDPTDILRDRRVAVTFAPVPGFRKRAASLEPVELHPWRWLRRPTSGSIASFSAWRRSVGG
jgi:deoxyribodipyrimidine photo-lyase